MTDARFEASDLVSGLVEPHEVRHIVRTGRMAIGPLGEALQNLTRARFFCGGRLRVANEDVMPAWRVADARCVERTADLEGGDSQHAILSAARHVCLQAIVGFRVRAVQERDTHFVRSRSRAETNVFQTLVDGVDGGRLVLLPANRGVVNRLVVECHDEVILELQVVHPQRLRHVGDVHDIVAVRGEVMLDGQAAAGAQRQPLATEVLRTVGFCEVGGAYRPCV